MKKLIILAAIVTFGYSSSYAQTATAERYVEDANAPKKVEEVKVNNSLEAEKAAKLQKEAKRKNVDVKNNSAETEKRKIEEIEKAKANKTQPASKSVKANSTNIIPVKKN